VTLELSISGPAARILGDRSNFSTTENNMERTEIEIDLNYTAVEA
jgi:hypothetical protein